MDSDWQSVSKITLDLPWQPARAGRQEEREKETESKGGGERGERGEGKREGGGVKGGAGPATMTSRACAEGRGRVRWKGSSENGEGGTYHNGKPGPENGIKRM